MSGQLSLACLALIPLAGARGGSRGLTCSWRRRRRRLRQSLICLALVELSTALRESQLTWSPQDPGQSLLQKLLETIGPISVIYSRPGADDQDWHSDGPHLSVPSHHLKSVKLLCSAPCCVEDCTSPIQSASPYAFCVFLALIDLDQLVGFTQVPLSCQGAYINLTCCSSGPARITKLALPVSAQLLLSWAVQVTGYVAFARLTPRLAVDGVVGAGGVVMYDYRLLYRPGAASCSGMPNSSAGIEGWQTRARRRNERFCSSSTIFPSTWRGRTTAKPTSSRRDRRSSDEASPFLSHYPVERFHAWKKRLENDWTSCGQSFDGRCRETPPASPHLHHSTNTQLVQSKLKRTYELF
eukprot:223289-Hanusia_phi.AAC.3